MRDEKKGFKNGWQLLSYFLKGSTHLFVLSMLCAAAVSFLDMLQPRIISFTVDSVIGNRTADLSGFLKRWADNGGIAYLRENTWRIGGGICAIALVAAVFRFLFRYLNASAAERFVETMRNCLYQKIERLPYAWHAKNSTGDIIQRCTSDVETIKVFVSEQLTALVRVVVLIILAVVFMGMINPVMTVAASVYIPVVVGYSIYFYSRIASAFEKADTQEGKLSAIAQENLTGVRVVRAFGREEYERKRFEKQNAYYTGFWIQLMRILTGNWIVGDAVTGLQILLVLVMGTAFCIQDRITAGQFIAFCSYNAMLIWPVRSLGRVISEMSKAGISLDRLLYIMREEEENYTEETTRASVQSAGQRTAELCSGDICFENVSFTYPGSVLPVLQDISFTVPEGTTLGILGGTGSGKSTMMYLLERLYPLQEGQGRITIGGTDIADIPLEELRRSIGMAAQEPFLFSRPLKDNLCIAAGEVAPEELDRAVATADLKETIESIPSGYDTFVGERGVTLSGGQKQRAAIARMLLEKCPILIFDDALSAVDAQTDVRIRQSLKRETKGSTVILISHRISTLMHADQILVMEHGRILERGTHETLLGRNGMYAQIFRLQMPGGGQQDEAGKGRSNAELRGQQDEAGESRGTAECHEQQDVKKGGERR